MLIEEAIFKTHEAIEGRYDLNGYDLYCIHSMLCEKAKKDLNINSCKPKKRNLFSKLFKKSI